MKKHTCAIVVGALLITGIPRQQVASAIGHGSQPTPPPPNLPQPGFDAQLTFDVVTPFQTAWMGDSANYSALPGYGLTTQQAQADYARVCLSGVKNVSTWYDMGWAYTAGYPTGSPNWTSTNMQWFYDFLAAMQSCGVNVMIKMGWLFPQNISLSSSVPSATPTPANETSFVTWVSESLNQFINVRGYTNVIGCFFFTEPSTVQYGSIPAGYASPQAYYAHIVSAVQTQIVSDDGGRTPIRPRILLTGPSEQSFTTDPWIQYLKANTSGLFDGYSFHSYRNTAAFPPLGIGGSDTYAAWISFFNGIVTDASPQPLAADESGFIIGGDQDTSGYRATSDAGWQWIRLVDGHMQAGCGSSYIWLLGDQPILGDPVTGPVLLYGTTGYIKEGNAVKPSWYAYSMHANLTGGGGIGGTKLYRNTAGGTSTLHGTGVFIPFGVKNTVSVGGEWSFVVINEGTAIDVPIAMNASIGNRTVYRYTYSGEIPPVAATNPAYLIPWDQEYTNVTTSIPQSRIPGHSVVIFSTMNIAAPPSQNLALAATATADQIGQGMPGNAILGNPSNVINDRNGWRKADDSPHWLQLTWPSPVTVGRLELAFVATTPGAVYATYADTSTPAPLASYTVQYWNGSAWVTVATVSGNTQPNVEHVFSPVSTTAIRLNALSAAATAFVNNIGAFAS